MTIRQLITTDIARSIPHSVRVRLAKGQTAGGGDIIALRKFTGLTQESFATALGISVYTLRNWEQDLRKPDGPALALMRVAALHPRVLKENLAMVG